MLPASTGHVRCSSCGSPTSIAATEARQTTVIIETAARVLAERPINGEKGSKSPRCRPTAGPTCRKCQEEFSADQDTPYKPGRRSLSPGPGLPGRVRRMVLASVLFLFSLHLLLCVVLAAREWRAAWAPVGASDAPSTGTSAPAIPRIIHQMYATSELPAKWKDVPEAWAATHPQYKYMLWTDDALRGLIESDYPWLLPTYDSYPYATQRWDASRFAILHK